MPENGPTLVPMAGLPGAGKSLLAQQLGRYLGWPSLDKDTVKTTLLEMEAGEEIAGRASYHVLLDLAADLTVGQGLSVILDTPAAYPNVIEIAQRIVADAGGRMRVVFCSADLETREQRTRQRLSRISQRGHPDRPASSRWHSPGDGREEFFSFLPPETIAASTTRPVQEIVPEVARQLTVPW